MPVGVPELLTLSGQGISPYAIRGVQQSYDWIEQAKQVKRTINGKAKDLSLAQFRKLLTTVSCNDQAPPVWIPPGTLLTVGCAAYMSYKTVGGSAQYTAVSGSSHVDGDYTFYRPSVAMILRELTIDADVWQAGVNWSMTLEESGV